MELVSGSTLSSLMDENVLTLGRTVEIIEAVTEALSQAHSQGIIHRDIKPSNIVINDFGQIKVLDFGLAKQLNEEQEIGSDPEALTLLASRTHSGAVVGTPLYLSPEQATGRPVDGRSDLFALGAVLYECISGRPAFGGGSLIEIGSKVINFDPPPPSRFNPRVPKALDRITLKALAKKPEERYQSAAQMRADLSAISPSLENEMERTRRIATTTAKLRSSALVTISDTLRRPRVSLGSLLLLLVIGSLTLWWAVRLLRPAPHRATPEAQRWYNTGSDLMRDGAYFQASKALEQSLAADNQFALAHARLAEAWAELDYADKAKDEMLRINALIPDRAALPRLEQLYLDAILSTVIREDARAIASYQEIVRLTPDQPQVYVDLGRAYEKANETQQAIASYVEAANRNPQYAAAFLRVGILYGRQQQLPSAAAAFAKAEELYQAQGNIEGRAEVLYQRGYLADKNGQIAEARPLLQQSLELARLTGNHYQQIQALLKLSSVAYTEGKTTEAEREAREAIELAQSNQMENLTSRGYVDIGNVFFVRGDYAEAENYFRQALNFAHRFKGLRSIARANLSLGSVLVQQGHADEALRYLTPALEFYEHGGFKQEASLARLLLGRANLQKGDYEVAGRIFEEQLRAAEQVKDQSQIAQFHEELGMVLTEQERYPEALAHFDRCYLINKELGDEVRVGSTLRYRANLLWRLGRYHEARADLEQIKALAARPGGSFKWLLGYSAVVGAQMALSEGRYSEAKELSQQATALVDARNKGDDIQVKRTLGLALVLSGAKREGRLRCEEALSLATELGRQGPLSASLLTLAQAMSESGDAQGALTTALRAQENFARSGLQDSEWRAWLIAARSCQQTGDLTLAREYAARAARLLSSLKDKWGEDAYRSYLTRPDVQASRNQLSTLSAES